MKGRLPRFGLLIVAVAAWWFGYRVLVPWVQRVVMWDATVTDPDARVVLGHWLAWQLPAVLLCMAVWLVGQRLGLMPSFVASFGGGGSWRRVLRNGLIASAALLVITVVVGAALGGTFGFHPDGKKMAGDVVSNMYEEIVNRGLMFSAFYGVGANRTFALAGALDRKGIVVGALGSSVIFAAGHTQYPLPLQVFMGLMALGVWAWPWWSARSLWAPYLPHTLGDVVGDTILKL